MAFLWMVPMNCHFWPVENNLRRLEKKSLELHFSLVLGQRLVLILALKSITWKKKYFFKKKIKARATFFYFSSILWFHRKYVRPYYRLDCMFLRIYIQKYFLFGHITCRQSIDPYWKQKTSDHEYQLVCSIIISCLVIFF